MVNVILSSFKQLPVNFNPVLLPIWFNTKERVLSDVAGGLVISSGNPLDFHFEI